jgi:alkanesulfonate monooxygenase SsuD/methylene tetrahydromethanopterin reductase-like flavin-dependent oxidoreductase (luciferase family)
MGIPVGLNVWSRLVDRTFPYLDKVIAPFDSVWMPDHVQYNGHDVAEGWTLLSFALARYPDKMGGHDVLCNSFRNPAHLAKMAATAQALSAGRVVLGIGAGWNEEEYRAYGWDYPSPRVRIAQLAEAIQLIRAMWTESPVSFDGKYYRIDAAHCEPRPDPVPPIMVGGAGEKYLLRVVADHADWWNFVYPGLETYAHKQQVLQEHCREVGRDYEEIVQVLHMGVLIAESEAELKRMQERDDVRPVDASTVAGTPEQVTDALLAAVEQGAQRISVHFADSPRPEGTWLFAATVLPHLTE